MNHQDHILNVSKTMEGDHETFCLNELKHEMKIYAERELEKRGRSHVKVEIFKDFYLEKYWVHTDRKCLKQIFTLLLDSAVKYTDRGCILFDFEVLSLSPVRNKVSFFIDDTSFGIYNENDLNYSIAQGLIQKLGGEMEIRPSHDAGLSVKFYIVCTPFGLNEN